MHSILTRLLLLSLCVFRNYFGFCWQLRMKPTDVWIAEWQVDGRSVRPHIDRQTDIRMDKLSGFWMNCLVDRPWRTNKYTKFSFVVHRHTSIYFLFLLPTDFPHFTIFFCVWIVWNFENGQNRQQNPTKITSTSYGANKKNKWKK